MLPNQKKFPFILLTAFVTGATVAGAVASYQRKKETAQWYEIQKDSISALRSCTDSMIKMDESNSEVQSLIATYEDAKDKNEKIKIADALIMKIK